MPIQPHITPAVQFTVPNKFPSPPVFKGPSADENNAMMQQYHTDMVQVLTRTFTAITQKIDTKQDKT